MTPSQIEWNELHWDSISKKVYVSIYVCICAIYVPSHQVASVIRDLNV